jgi:lipopolysaccharide transport system permease protein
MSHLLWAANPFRVLRHFRQYRYLLLRLAWREVELRYRGSFLGVFWSLLTPLVMLAVYTFVFSVVFQARWGTSGSQSRVDFALAVFAGLTAFNLFADTVRSAPSLVLSNSNYVKRVVFPLEILPVARLLSNLVQAGLGFAVLLAAVLLLKGGLPWTLVFLPLVIVPLSLLSLGCAFFLSSLGVFVRDIGQVVGLVVTMLLFLSAIFYPLSRLPGPYQSVLCFNPLVPMIEDVRRVTLFGLMPDWPTWSAVTLVGGLTTLAGLTWFMKSKNAFADVL